MRTHLLIPAGIAAAAVRNPQELTRLVRDNDDGLIEVVDRRIITVSLDCSR